ncbi:hypothetical protein [Nitrolancea hollandica]|uniref:Uncharacterized protein n=1 Tax=Nitrolancea hollandica Lb TaxID=1129897 RepID=I4EFJ9_9BACT|nr:hypothetical protein [Nitrolancea hollandica]CCF83461.1 hypothetical protein NITHO_2310004 [Nitrolancea hollandica Lb]
MESNPDPVHRLRPGGGCPISTWQKRAKDRGKAFEKKVAGFLKAHRWEGYDGDIDFPPYRGEAKYNGDFRENSELKSYLKQIERYITEDWKPGQRWFLAITGGKSAMFRKLSPSGIFILISGEEFRELDAARRRLEELERQSRTGLSG